MASAAVACGWSGNGRRPGAGSRKNCGRWPRGSNGSRGPRRAPVPVGPRTWATMPGPILPTPGSGPPRRCVGGTAGRHPPEKGNRCRGWLHVAADRRSTMLKPTGTTRRHFVTPVGGDRVRPRGAWLRVKASALRGAPVAALDDWAVCAVDTVRQDRLLGPPAEPTRTPGATASATGESGDPAGLAEFSVRGGSGAAGVTAGDARGATAGHRRGRNRLSVTGATGFRPTSGRTSRSARRWTRREC